MVVLVHICAEVFILQLGQGDITKINNLPAATVVGTELTIAKHVSAWTDPRQAGQEIKSHPLTLASTLENPGTNMYRGYNHHSPKELIFLILYILVKCLNNCI